MMARSAAQRCKEYRLRRELQLDTGPIDYKREVVLALMSAEQYADQAERRRILSDWLHQSLLARLYATACHEDAE